MRLSLSSALVTMLLIPGYANAQNAQPDTIFFASPDRLTIRNMRAVPAIELTPHLHLHTVVGNTASVSFAELDSGAVVAVHHHTREQVDVGLTGVIEATIGSHTEFLSPGTGIVIPADVDHGFRNGSPRPATAIEFHTVPRPDLVPPRPPMKFPAAPEPTGTPADQHLITRIDSSSGGMLEGRSCVVRWRSLTGPVEVHPHPTATELFVYVARGNATVIAAGHVHTISEGSLVIIPGGLTSVRIDPRGSSSTALVEFQMRALPETEGQAQQGTMSVAERQVRATDSARFAAMTHQDFAALDTLLGNDLTYTHNDGTRESKSVFLGSLRSGELTYLALEPDSEVVRIYGTTAVADGRILLRARLDKQVGHFTARFLEVSAQRSGHWELVAWQSTRLTDVVWEK